MYFTLIYKKISVKHASSVEWHFTIVKWHLTSEKCHFSSVECHSTVKPRCFTAEKCGDRPSSPIKKLGMSIAHPPFVVHISLREE